MYKALILDANQRSALAVVRSLGKRGIDVHAADSHESPIACASRHVRTSLRYTDPARNPEAFREDIASLVSQYRIDVVMPASDLTTMILVEGNAPAGARVACALPDSYNLLTDKRSLLDLARELGMRVPYTAVVTNREELLEAASRLGYPVVLKPSRSRYFAEGKVHSTQVLVVPDSAAIEAAVNRLTSLYSVPCLVQEFIPGHGAGLFAFRGTDGAQVFFAHRRIREKPPSGGVSVLSESVAARTDLQDAASRLLAAADWTGAAMLEYRIDPGGTPYLMEVNGRFWGSLQLAVDSGVDFPWLQFAMAAGIHIELPGTYARGRRLRWLLGDADNLLIQLRTPGLPAQDKLAVTARFLAACVDLRCQQEVFRWSDPMPAFRELRQWISGMLQ